MAFLNIPDFLKRYTNEYIHTKTQQLWHSGEDEFTKLLAKYDRRAADGRETVGATGQILSWHGTAPTAIVKVLSLVGQVIHSSSETSVEVLNKGLRINLFVMVIAEDFTERHQMF